MSRGDPAGTDRSDGPPEFEEGRYLYCVVRADETDASLETTGIDDEAVSVVVDDGIGAVVHACDELYDSADLERIRRWVVRHQSVVDDAADAFGTPLPFQFDTIVRGDDEVVRTWLRDEREGIVAALDALADHWEYRIEVVRTDPIDEATLLERDDRLSELRERIDDADDGTAFLLEKQFDDRIRERRRARRDAVSTDLRERLEPHAREVRELERTASTRVAGGDAAADGSTDDGETVCRMTLLATEDEAGEIGALLDDVAAEPGREVRFTGPWPPYTFAPELGSEDDPRDGRGTDEYR
ncbi:gas vesicle protein GvpL [Natrialbaceae archaeon AArc-T1-2]|uniref:gas vesicle protein GvpL n=1 Tax=Natrialbaceae archaeon AArc-T1-2 TaxID=3053904 RepID=UPI00255AF5D6|nr:GvpL/GvpF family gas vesicle protein [Natrialbaceae archaeon AArc-T1-2]WIV67585.1 GvpL/GvpF family gas vesicle protein [Natrialbaceae archaeon AArc-T1-2]